MLFKGEKMLKKNYPVLLVGSARRNNTFSDCYIVKAWCPFCKKEHEHSASKHGTTHRLAHCTNRESPFLNGGYMLKISEKVLELAK